MDNPQDLRQIETADRTVEFQARDESLGEGDWK